MDTFSGSAVGLPEATRPQVRELADGESLALRVGPVAKRLDGSTVRMLAYDGSIPGPTVVVREGSEVLVDVRNGTELETTVHWHGLRLRNEYDGVPGETQAPVPPGGRFTYRLQFPDPGLYWYHPHVREDYTQEMGLYGNVLVVPRDPDYWPPAHRDVVLTLDDLLVEDGAIAPFSRTETTHAAMGRFGNVLLVGGETDATMAARRGEVVRLWLTNTANTRVFNVRLPGARMKIVGGDSGRVEHEEHVDEVLLAPSERAVVDVLLEHTGRFTLEHQTPTRTYHLATVAVSDEVAEPSLRESFEVCRRAPELHAEREHLDAWLAAAPDKVLAIVAEMDDLGAPDGGPQCYGCPMHPAVVSDAPGRCPQCGMKLLLLAVTVVYVCPMHPHVRSEAPGRCPQCGMKLLVAQPAAAVPGGADPHSHDFTQVAAQHSEAPTTGHGHGTADGGYGIEWEDDMEEVNRRTTPSTMRWALHDRTSGGDSPPSDWRFTVGDRVKLRLVNEMDSDHPMHHPFHVHGAGRFLVLARDGEPEPNLVWKDTVLVRTGQTVDLLFDVTNPGVWMAHCHIPEHMQSGMMFSFTVTPTPGPSA